MGNKIDVVGIGLDGLTGLGERVRDFISQATVLVGSERHLSYVAGSAKRVVLGDFLAVTKDIETLHQQGEDSYLSQWRSSILWFRTFIIREIA